jgi:hypothetical protein
MTNQQAVLKAQAKMDKLRDAYVAYITPLALAFQEEKKAPSTHELLECRRLGSAYFNALENFVVNSGLLEAHFNGRWVTNLAENCHAGLSSYVMHYNFLRSHDDDPDQRIEPDKHAMAGMQRMVKEYLDEDTSDELHQTFVTAGLPIQGFTVPAHEDVKPIPSGQLIACGAGGLVLLFLSVILALVIPYPSPYQTLIFRGMFSIGLAATASGVPGFLNVRIKIKGWNNYGKIVAGGAIAIFVLTFFFNSADLQDRADSSQSSTQPSKQLSSEK